MNRSINELTEARNIFAAELARLEALAEQQRTIIAALDAQIAKAQPEPTEKPATEKPAEVTTLDRFLEYAADACNWSGRPLVGGNVGGDASDKGYIVNMKKRGLVETFEYDRCIWIDFTDKGVALAAEHGITIEAA